MLARRRPNGSNHVAVLGGHLVGLRLRGCFHLFDQFFEQGCSVAVEHPADGFHPFVVPRPVNARPGAQADVHGKTALGKQFLAVADAKLPSKELHHLLGGAGVGEGPPLLSGFWRPPRVHDAGVFFVRHGEVGEGFPVLEHGIEPRHVFADQLSLEDEGGLGGLGDDALDVVGALHQFRDHVAVGVAGKVRADALVEARGFSNVEHPSLCVFEQVDARFVWEVGRSQIHGHANTTPAMTQKGNPVSPQAQPWG